MGSGHSWSEVRPGYEIADCIGETTTGQVKSDFVSAHDKITERTPTVSLSNHLGGSGDLMGRQDAFAICDMREIGGEADAVESDPPPPEGLFVEQPICATQRIGHDDCRVAFKLLFAGGNDPTACLQNRAEPWSWRGMVVPIDKSNVQARRDSPAQGCLPDAHRTFKRHDNQRHSQSSSHSRRAPEYPGGSVFLACALTTQGIGHQHPLETDSV